MKHVKSTCAVAFVSGLAISSGAASAGISGWDILIQMGDGNAWSVANNPQSYELTTRTRIDNGHTVYRITGSWETSSWAGDWEIEFDPDPFVSSAFTIQNLTGNLAPFTVTVIAPSIALSAPTTMTGSISGTVGDGDGIADQFGNGATVMTQGNGRPYYEALVDGADIRSLYAAPQTNVAPLLGTADIDTQSYINEVGPAVISTIGIRNAFMLTPGDNASFTSTFFIIPTPGTLALVGLAGVAAIRRRR